MAVVKLCMVFDDNLFDFRYNIFTSWKILKGRKWVSDGVCIFPIQILIVSLRGSFYLDQVVRFYIIIPSSLLPMTVQVQRYNRHSSLDYCTQAFILF